MNFQTITCQTIKSPLLLGQKQLKSTQNRGWKYFSQCDKPYYSSRGVSSNTTLFELKEIFGDIMVRKIIIEIHYENQYTK